MSLLNRYNRFLECIGGFNNLYCYKDKKRNLSDYTAYMLARLQSMFKYDGFPESIPQRDFELLLMCNGHTCITDVNGDLYALSGGLGGEPNAYYMPTIYTVANPYLNFSKNLKIDEDCIVISNDSLYIGLLPLIQRYCSIMVENDISITIATINSRIQDILTATTDSVKESAELYLEKIEKGDLGIIGDSGIFGETDLSFLQSNQGKTGILTDLIELQQYTKASLFNELGLNANYNMKRESLNSAESELNDDALLPLIDDMLRCRKIGIEKVNEKYGTNIKVNFASAWEDNQKELELKQEELESDADANADADIEKGGEYSEQEANIE